MRTGFFVGRMSMRRTKLWRSVLPVLLSAAMCCTAVPAYAEDAAETEAAIEDEYLGGYLKTMG